MPYYCKLCLSKIVLHHSISSELVDQCDFTMNRNENGNGNSSRNDEGVDKIIDTSGDDDKEKEKEKSNRLYYTSHTLYFKPCS